MHSKQYQQLLNRREWRVLRAEWLTDHPLCECCKRKGFIRSARAIHHITPVESARTDREMEALCYSRTNLMSVCFECHAEIHKAQRSHSKQAHKQREQERLERFKARIGSLTPSPSPTRRGE